MGRLSDRVALVVGAGSAGPGWGIGKATAVLFAREGAQVVACDIDRAAAEETVRIIESEGGVAAAHQADASDGGQVAGLVRFAVARFGRIDVLQNNVGIVVLGGTVDLAEEQWDRVQAVNLKSFFLTAKHVLPVMEAQGSGSIVNVSSIASIRWTGLPYVAYSASKAAVNQLTQSIAIENARKGIRCNAVLPGLMDTPLLERSIVGGRGGDDLADVRAQRNERCPTGKMGDAWDVAHASLFLAGDESRYITGHCLVVDGGLTCVAG